MFLKLFKGGYIRNVRM